MKLKTRMTALLAAAAVLLTGSTGALQCVAESAAVPMGTVQMANASSGSLTYQNRGGYIEITGCDTSVTSVQIPSQINGVPVTKIGNLAFYYCRYMTSITIPNTVTTIGDRAFHGCEKLSALELPNSVTTIGLETFYGCKALKSVRLPDSITTVGDGIFTFCSGLTEVVLPARLTQINSCMFYNCTSLKSVTVPSTVKSIGDWAFDSCSSLTDIYYSGSNQMWNAIPVGKLNSALKKATIHCDPNAQSSTPPAATTTTTTTTTKPTTTTTTTTSTAPTTTTTTTTSTPPATTTTTTSTTPPTTTTTSTTTTTTTWTQPTTTSTSTTTSVVNQNNSVSFSGVPSSLKAGEYAYVNINDNAGGLTGFRIADERIAKVVQVYGQNPYSISLQIQAISSGTATLIAVTGGRESSISFTVTGGESGTTVTPPATEPIATTTTTIPPQPAADRLGDVNRDTKVNASDAAAVLVAAAAVGSGKASGLNREQEKDADVNGDGKFGAQDASLILRYAAAAGTGSKLTLREFLALYK